MFNLFIKVVAIIFLILFFIKIINPKTFPFIKTGYETMIQFIVYTFKLLVKSSIFTIYLLFNRTVYIIGLDIVFALVFNIIITIIVYPHYDIHIWFTLFKNNLLSSYVLSFFVCTYLIGLYEYLKFKKYINLPFDFHKKSNKTIKKGYYTYDNKSNEYTYHD